MFNLCINLDNGYNYFTQKYKFMRFIYTSYQFFLTQYQSYIKIKRYNNII